MAEELEAIKTLTTAKEKLIEERRTLAVALALRRRRPEDQTTETCRSFINVQDLIEAIDRAITHEKRIASEQPKSLGVTALEATPVQ
jgi:hypothetical protein